MLLKVQNNEQKGHRLFLAVTLILIYVCILSLNYKYVSTTLTISSYVPFWFAITFVTPIFVQIHVTTHDECEYIT